VPEGQPDPLRLATYLCPAEERPYPPPASDEPEAVEATRLLVEQSLNALHDALEAELWQTRG